MVIRERLQKGEILFGPCISKKYSSFEVFCFLGPPPLLEVRPLELTKTTLLFYHPLPLVGSKAKEEVEMCDVTEILTPTPINYEGPPIVKICSGIDYNLMLDVEGNAWTFGNQVFKKEMIVPSCNHYKSLNPFKILTF